MGKYTIFYSWQSDLPNSTNRGFIQKALEDAARSIGGDPSIDIEARVERDTAGVPGSPDIVDAIFQKIKRADVFACDVSIVNEGEKSRPAPNPNVLIELDYALHTLGWQRIIMIMNTAYGKPDKLPFDLKMRRVTTYEVVAEGDNKGEERRRLSGVLDDAVRTTISQARTSLHRRIPSGDKTALAAECEGVLGRGDVNECSVAAKLMDIIRSFCR